MTDKPQATARPLTLGTAGHIDHGKTALVKALTGRDTDRLKEEKERGISIELGYAELRLPSGRTMSVVDVPGHERFVRTMVAGASGIDLFLLVVAADDGVMPQTREHLRIIELLGIPAGAVALTKIDTVDEDMVELAQVSVEELLGTTPYADAPIVPVDSLTGQGLPALLVALERLGAAAAPRCGYPTTRMPVDRVFSLKGAGTVVTGTLWSGTLSTEDRVVLLPGLLGRGAGARREVRVRSVQVHDRQVAQAGGGQRVALNLTGVDRDEVTRGQWVVKDPSVDPTYIADVRLTLPVDSPGSVPRVSRVRVDHGTAELLAKVVLVDREVLPPGASGYAQLRFEEPAVLYPGDRFIARSMTPVTTLGGGRVIDPAARKHGAGPRWQGRLALLEEGPSEAICALLLEEAFPALVTRARLEASPYLWRFTAPEIGAAVASLLADGRAVNVVAPGAGRAGVGRAGAGTTATAAGATPAVGDARLAHGPSLEALKERALASLQSRAQREALDPYLSVAELRQELVGGKEAQALELALEWLEGQGSVVRTEHGYRWAGAAPGPGGAQAGPAERLLAQFAEGEGEASAGAEVLSVARAAAAAGLEPREAQRMIASLVREKRLVRVGEDLYYPPERLEPLLRRLTQAMEAAGQMTLAEARDLLGTSRKFAQALLEHMDSVGLTLRVGDARRLRSRRRERPG